MEKSIDELLTEFMGLKFGMFIHFNMETYTGVKNNIEGYASPSKFDPGGKIDTDAWADAAKAAGMTYGVLTTKHCAGFCLWDSAYTTYSVMHPDCPYQQDLVAQFIDSFTSRGLKTGLYYSPRHPEHDKPDCNHNMVPPEVDPASHSPEEILEFEKAQITELITKFPETFYIWNDGLDDEIMSIEEATVFFRNLPRPVLANNNWFDWGKKGQPYLDICTTEGRLPTKDNQLPTETCWTLENEWFTGKCDGSPKTAEYMVAQILAANSRNANFLLNVGPDTSGRITDLSIKKLEGIGDLLNPIRKILEGKK